MAESMSRLLAKTVQDLAACWKQLVATDVVCKAIAFVMLAPLLALFTRVLLSASGNDLLADQDILFFLLGPVGWANAALAGGLWLGIVALEQAALLWILVARGQAEVPPAPQAIRFAGRSALPVIKLTVRMVASTLLIAAPFLGVIGLVYALLLDDHDINFYLKEKPPEFLAAVGLAALFLAALGGILLRFFSGWFVALPVLLFEKTSPGDALQVSNSLVKGSRGLVVAEILLWLVGTTILAALAGGVVVGVGRMVGPMIAESLVLLVTVVGALVLVGGGLTLATNLLSTVLFASMLAATYEHLGGEVRLEAPLEEESTSNRARLWLTTRWLVVLSLAAVVITAALGALLVPTIRTGHVAVVAHRGASARAPENTLASIRLAIEEEADWVEIDVQETADGELVVFHDSDFMKLAGNPLKIWEATTADLGVIDIGSSFSSDFSEERAPLLGDVLALCKGKVRVLIELKYYGHDDQLEQRVVDKVDELGMQAEVMYMSLKLPAVERLKSLDPQARVGVLLSVVAGNLNVFPADLWAMNARFADRRTIKEAHQHGRLVYVWTVNDALTMSRMIGRGVDGLITDDPALAREVIRQRNLLSTAERTLLELADLFGVEPKVRDQ